VLVALVVEHQTARLEIADDLGVGVLEPHAVHGEPAAILPWLSMVSMTGRPQRRPVW
jgi:hypothetical protein